MYKVMLVEDEELIRTMIKLNLEKAGYSVTCCEDAESMLEVIDANGYDLVLLDVMLPGVAGNRALETMRQRGNNTPVIMVTAKNDMDTKAHSFGKGADDYIAKPFNMKELLFRIEAVIRRSQGERIRSSVRATAAL